MAIVATDSPGSHSSKKGEPNRCASQGSVSRGDSLVYSEDSQDQRSLLSAAVKGSGYTTSQYNQNHERHVKNDSQQRQYNSEHVVLKRPCCQHKTNTHSMNESVVSEDSLNEKGKTACCVIQ